MVEVSGAFGNNPPLARSALRFGSVFISETGPSLNASFGAVRAPHEARRWIYFLT